MANTNTHAREKKLNVSCLSCKTFGIHSIMYTLTKNKYLCQQKWNLRFIACYKKLLPRMSHIVVITISRIPVTFMHIASSTNIFNSQAIQTATQSPTRSSVKSFYQSSCLSVAKCSSNMHKHYDSLRDAWEILSASSQI